MESLSHKLRYLCLSILIAVATGCSEHAADQQAQLCSIGESAGSRGLGLENRTDTKALFVNVESRPELRIEVPVEAYDGAPDEPVVSQSRGKSEPWEQALDRSIKSTLRRNDSRWNHEVLYPNNMEESSVPYSSQVDISYLPEWTLGEEALLQAHRIARDERIYEDPAREGFKRRALWLYPYNACFVRAAHVAISIEKQKLPRPGKVFAFGDLRLTTPYDKDGAVYWSYHVAAAYRINGKAYVLDAGVEPDKLMSLEGWLERISSDPSKVRVNICDTFAYTPLNPCRGGIRKQERSTVNHLKSYLPDEWNRLVELDMNAEKLLGDEPPWKVPAAEVPPVAPIDTTPRVSDSDTASGNDSEGVRTGTPQASTCHYSHL